jgi:hypothetical protein
MAIPTAELLDTLPSRTLSEVLGALSSRAIAPGAGGATGIVLALAAGCAQKAVAVTRKREGADTGLSTVEDDLLRLREQALACAADDGRCYMAYAKSPGPDTARELVLAGERFLDCALRLGERMAWLNGRVDPVVAGDLGSGAQLQAAVVRIVTEIIRDNRALTEGH